MRKWTLADCPVMPWKNGGGTTTEMAIFPPGATLENFDWRISSASVISDGPFSAFPGIDRSLALLDGVAMALTVDDIEQIGLSAAREPFCFAGERKVVATLPDGPVRDLNVMTRRSAWTHQLQRLADNQTYRFSRPGQLLWLYCATGQGSLTLSPAAHGLRYSLNAGEMILLDHADSTKHMDHAGELSLQASSSSVFYLLHLFSKD